MANELNIGLGKRRGLTANIGAPGYLGKGDPGVGIEDIAFIREDVEGNVYRIYLTDGTSYYFTAPKGTDGAPGKDGEPGKDGTDGAAGADGITPHIGDNGNWYLGTTDTGKPSRGEKGTDGGSGGDSGAGLRWRGEYDDFTAYAKGDAVSSNGSSFIFVSEIDAQGAIPGIDPEWELLASCGADYRLTASDKSEITQAVLSAMPSWKGGAY